MQKQPGCWLRSSHSLKECVIAHWSSESAPKITGAKLFTEIADLENREQSIENRMESEDMIESYRDLEIYKKSYKVALDVHELTRKFPSEERYDFRAQRKEKRSQRKEENRKAIFNKSLFSILCYLFSRIAEGYGRYSKDEFKRFARISLGSCNEMQVHLSFCKDLGYINIEEYEIYNQEYQEIGKMLTRSIEKWKQKHSILCALFSVL